MIVNGEHSKNAATKLPMPEGYDRLDSWKQIAVYLGREVRTVQRWEKREDLPVRRHMHLKGSTVYAFKNEINAWLTNRGERASESRPIQKRWGQTVNAIGATRQIGWFLLGLSLFLGVLNLAWAFPKSVFGAEPAATTTVLVYNHAGVSRSILAAAEREAGRILGGAGVRIIWVECPMRSTTASAEGPCLGTLKSTDIMLRVLPPLAHHSLKADVFGFAISPILASVYYEYAARLAVEEEYVEFGARTILGCVIAHELGHLLLRSNSHSSAGIMQSPWGEKQVREALNGTLLFTAEQAKLMQAQVRARMRPQRNNPKDEVMQNTYPFGQTNETSASTSKKEEHGYLLSGGEFTSIDFPVAVSPVGGEFRKFPEFLSFFSLIPSSACATFSLFFCMPS